ncbi:MAG: alpha/beta fold hydrolase, partial [Verrucomicrobiia bacterium]
YPNGGLSPAVTAMVSNTPPAPSGLSATVDSTGTNVLLSWSPAVGAVTNYIILRGTYNSSTGNYSYSQIGEVNKNTTSFEDFGAISGNNGYNNVYEVEALYAGGQLSPVDSSYVYQSSTAPAYNLSVAAHLVRNQTGHWQLMFSGIPASVQAVALYWYDFDYWAGFDPDPAVYAGYPFSVETDIPVGSLTNGIYVIPDFMTTNGIPDNNFMGKVAMVQPIGTNNERGSVSQAGFLPDDSPCFVDGRQHLKQNLLYKLREATISQPNSPLSDNNVYYDPGYWNFGIPADTNYVESSLFHWAVQLSYWEISNDGQYFDGDGENEFLAMDDLWPITANYQLHQTLYDTNYTGPSSFVWQTNLLTVPAPAVLGISDPYWISQNLGNLADVAAYTNSGNLYLQNGVNNLFGLAFKTALVNRGNYYNPIITVAPGGSTGMTNVNCFFSQTVDPSLAIVSYYFAPVNTPGTALPVLDSTYQTYPLPALTGFSSTNQTGMLITSVGTPTVIGGWAKFSIQNGSSSKFAYLGQYYLTNAFVMTNGIVTTNTSGVVSPYGDFFPTQPGMVALVTMPDINTGQQGTGVVRVVALSADANHDGTMDFTYQGPDFVSASKPFRFWVDDTSDAGDFGGTGIPGQGAQGNGVLQIQRQWKIHGRRDLVNYFPLYINISSLFQSNALSAGISFTDTNWSFVLSQADGVLRFAYTDLTPTNYMNFLHDTNESGNLANASLTTITNAANGGVTLLQSFVGGIATNNQGIILVEAAASTTQPLVLTIYHGTNQIAQTSLYLSISGVEQMFRYKNLLIGAATNQANLLPDRLTDASVPNEPDTIDKNVVFVHGYNVSPYQARGWFADIYKRLYWSGSHARFYGVNWYGNDSQGNWISGVTANYQTNVVHAFQTAPLLANFIATLTNGPTTVMAHSLGNMVALSAMSDWNAPISQYFMVDAAVPMEAIDGSTPINTNMVYSTSSAPWLNYATALWASEWFNVWPTNDARSTLTWNNRFGNFGSTAVYNFYSSGEEVLRTYSGAPPSNLILLFGAQLVQWIEGQSGTYVWAWQEKDKGQMLGNTILSSDHGGWGLNENLNSGYVFFVNGLRTNIPPAVITNSVLQTNAFFDMSVDTAMFTASSSGSAYVQTNRNRILSDAIPALTLPLGANADTNLDIRFGGTRNFDMQSSYENGWPTGRGAPQWPIGTTAFGEWHHSDARIVAYTFTYQLFKQMVTTGNLK